MVKIILVLAAGLSLAAQTSSDGPRFVTDGELALPKDYREWVFLSSGLGMTYGPAADADRGSPKFENVFVNPSAWRVFSATGRWPDKSIFILEIRRAEEKGSINNAGHYQGEILAVEAEVKDESHFPGKWAYFAFGKGDKAAPFPVTSACNECHSRSAALENTFVQFYPGPLETATRKGTLNRSWVKNPTKE